MDMTFIDPEPPDATGGGIRTYLRLVARACRAQGWPVRVYTHNPGAYAAAVAAGAEALAIGRRPLPRPWRSLLYRLAYGENLAFEHALWLRDELEKGDGPGRLYEFCDYGGYAFFALRHPWLRARTVVRIHTPHYLAARPARTLAFPAWALGRFRERQCLRRAERLTAPSAEFARERLPWLRGWTYLPNPLPDREAAAHVPGPLPASGDILYLGRVEPRKGVLVLVRAFLRLAAENPRARLTLVGAASPGAYSQSVRALIDAQPPELRARLAWEPPCPPERRAALLGRFRVLAVPSLWENSPYVYFEGLSAGLLCVGSATGEMKAAAEVTGGLLARPGDEKDWLRALRRAVGGDFGGEAREAQRRYLETRRPDVLARTLDYYRGAADAAGAWGAAKGAGP